MLLKGAFSVVMTLFCQNPFKAGQYFMQKGLPVVLLGEVTLALWSHVWEGEKV